MGENKQHWKGFILCIWQCNKLKILRKQRGTYWNLQKAINLKDKIGLN